MLLSLHIYNDEQQWQQQLQFFLFRIQHAGVMSHEVSD
jgi:hypothetical protein